MLLEFGITVDMVNNPNTVPTSAREMADTFKKVSADAANAVKQQ